MTSPAKIRQALETGPADFYHLMTLTSLSAVTLNKHLGEMLDSGEIKEVSGKEIVMLTISEVKDEIQNVSQV